MKPWALGVSSTLAPWSMAMKSTSAAGYIPTKRWGSRGFAPLGCLPLRGSEGVTIAIFTEREFSLSVKNDFYRAQKLKICAQPMDSK
jgi:hypothetical protein